MESNQVMIFAKRGKLEYPGKLSKNKIKKTVYIYTIVWLKAKPTPLHIVQNWDPAAFIYNVTIHERINVIQPFYSIMNDTESKVDDQVKEYK